MASEPISDHMCKALSCKKNSNPATVQHLCWNLCPLVLGNDAVCDVTVHVTNAISNTKHIVIEIQGLT